MTPRPIKIAAILALSVACSAETPASDQAAATGLRREQPIQLTRRADGLTASLDWRQQTGTVVLQITSEKSLDTSNLSMSKRIDMWRPLLQQFFTEHGRRDSYLLTVGEYPELRSRVAAAAACSSELDTQAGRSRLFSNMALYPELVGLLREFRYDITADTVESIVMCSWSQVRDSRAECGRNLAANAQVPCGASIVFRMTANP